MLTLTSPFPLHGGGGLFFMKGELWLLENGLELKKDYPREINRYYFVADWGRD